MPETSNAKVNTAFAYDEQMSSSSKSKSLEKAQQPGLVKDGRPRTD